MRKLIQKFKATDEKGLVHELKAYQRFDDAGTFHNPQARAPGLIEFFTDEGQDVNRLDKGKYEIVATGEILTSSAPDAP